MADLMPTIKSMLSDYGWMKNQEFFKTLTPEVQSAVSSLAAMATLASKPKDPFSGKSGAAMTSDDIDKMQGFAQVIMDAAKTNKLVR